MKRRHYAWLGAAALLLISGAVFAQSLPLITSGAGKGGTTYSIPVQTVIALTALSILPAALMLMTSLYRFYTFC
jgi:flagellar biosynthetic protein FliP